MKLATRHGWELQGPNPRHSHLALRRSLNLHAINMSRLSTLSCFKIPLETPQTQLMFNKEERRKKNPLILSGTNILAH